MKVWWSLRSPPLPSASPLFLSLHSIVIQSVIFSIQTKPPHPSHSDSIRWKNISRILNPGMEKCCAVLCVCGCIHKHYKHINGFIWQCTGMSLLYHDGSECWVIIGSECNEEKIEMKIIFNNKFRNESLWFIRGFFCYSQHNFWHYFF